jgi:hypothetical protein
MIDTFVDLTVKEDEVECKGLIFRAHINTFINVKGVYVVTKRLTPLKRKSCKGCEKCGWMMDEMQEFIGMEIPIGDDVEDNKIYQLVVTGVGRDWESGIVDEYDLGFVEVKDENGH